MISIVLVNWLLCITTSIILLVAWWRYRYLMIKPSFMVIVYFHLTIQWSGTINTEGVNNFLQEPSIFYLIAHGFPLIGLMGTILFLPKQTSLVFQRLQQPTWQFMKEQQQAAWTLFSLVVIVAIYYFSVVPPTSTGLYAIIFDPSNSALARENSLKLIDDGLLQYLFSFTANAIALLLVVFLFSIVRNLVRQQRRTYAVIYLIIMLLLFMFISVTGARAFAANLMLAFVLAWFNLRGGRINFVHIAIAALLVLTLPTLFTVFRSGQDRTFETYYSYLTQAMLNRVFVVPMETALWHTHFSQNIGFIGIAGIPKLASLFGVDSVNVANLIGVYYSQSRLDSVTANTAYVYSYYSYFGFIAFPISLLALWLLDGTILLFRRLSYVTLLPCVVAIQVASLSFAAADYTRVLVTKGFLIILILSWLIDRVFRPKTSDQLVSTPLTKAVTDMK